MEVARAEPEAHSKSFNAALIQRPSQNQSERSGDRSRCANSSGRSWGLRGAGSACMGENQPLQPTALGRDQVGYQTPVRKTPDTTQSNVRSAPIHAPQNDLPSLSQKPVGSRGGGHSVFTYLQNEIAIVLSSKPCWSRAYGLVSPVVTVKKVAGLLSLL